MDQAERDKAIEELRRQWNVPRAQLAILAALLDGVPRKFLHRTVGVSENTVKTQVRAILRRFGFDQTDTLTWWLRARAGDRIAFGDFATTPELRPTTAAPAPVTPADAADAIFTF